MKEEAQASTSQSSADIKLDMMIKAMERLMDRLLVDDRGQNPKRERNETQIRSPNFRQPRQQVPQILQRGQRPQNDQVKPPFQHIFLENEGAFVSILSSTAWKYLGSLGLVPPTNHLLAFKQ